MACEKENYWFFISGEWFEFSPGLGALFTRQK
jgi:hypothetical protein